MTKALRTAIPPVFLAALALSSGCAGDDEPAGGPDAAQARPDAGGATDAGRDDAGSADAGGGAADAGPMTCNPVDGSGCEGGQICQVNGQLGPQCRVPAAMPRAFGEACDQATIDCESGLACISLPNDAAATCHQVCRPSGNDCTNLPDPQMRDHVCRGLDSFGGYGVCRPSRLCRPTDRMPCPAGQTCSVVGGTLTTECSAAGGAQLGQACSAMNNCAPGQGICINLGGDQRCYEPCFLQGGTCTQRNYRCSAFGPAGMTYPFGICTPPATGACNPFTRPCPAGQVCAVNAAANGVECVAAGTAPIGGDCSSVSCQPGGVCVPVTGGGRQCLAPCDLDNPMCPSGTCQNLGLDFGICG